MAPNLLFYQLLLVTLVLICLMIHVWWLDKPSVISPIPLEASIRGSATWPP